MMILQILSAFSAVLVFTMILEIPKKYMLYASASGAVGWWAYLMVQNSGHSSMLAAFLSTLVVAFLSHILARVKKAPVRSSPARRSSQPSSVIYTAPAPKASGILPPRQGFCLTR